MKPRLVWIETHPQEERGFLSTIEPDVDGIVPFDVKRVFYIYNVPMHVVRGGHGHKKCHQFMLAISGMVLVKLDDGTEFLLDRPEFGLYLPPGNIMRMIFLTTNACLLVLASEKYDSEDYVKGSYE